MGSGEQLRAAVVGVGPVGGILAAHLVHGGNIVYPVDILKDHLTAIKTQGLRVSGLEDLKVVIPEVCYDISELKGRDIDVIFAAVKACVLPKIIESLKDVIEPGTYVVSYQNGMDTEEMLADAFGRGYALRVVVNYAGGFVENGHVRMTFFNKPNYIGAASDDGVEFAKRIAKIMTAAGLETEYTSEIRKYVWEKVILNSALGTLCAVTGQTMKQAMDLPETFDIVQNLAREGIAVAAAAGYEYGDDFFDFCIDYLRKGGDHKPSTLVDVECKRPTEIEFLNGKIVEYGKRLGIETPYQTTVTNLLRAKQDLYLKGD
ncbi:MAG: ketopantoate reductase family protein [Thermoplasmata archaeon]